MHQSLVVGLVVNVITFDLMCLVPRRLRVSHRLRNIETERSELLTERAEICRRFEIIMGRKSHPDKAPNNPQHSALVQSLSSIAKDAFRKKNAVGRGRLSCQ